MNQHTFPPIEAYFPYAYRPDVPQKLFISNISIGDRREVLQGNGHRNQLVAICITPEFAEKVVRAVNNHDKLLAAAERVLAHLNERIDVAAKSDAPHPVFDGIGELHHAVNLARAS